MYYEINDEFVFSHNTSGQEVLASCDASSPTQLEKQRSLLVGELNAAADYALSIGAYNSALQIAKCLTQGDENRAALLAKALKEKVKTSKEPAFGKPMSALTI